MVFGWVELFALEAVMCVGCVDSAGISLSPQIRLSGVIYILPDSANHRKDHEFLIPVYIPV